MSGYSITITTSSGTKTIDAHARFDIRSSKRLNQNDKTDFTETFIDVEGDIVPTTPNDPDEIESAVHELYDLAGTTLAPVTVKVYLDGVEKYSFTPAASLGSPHVVDFATVPADGNGGSHHRYRLSIYVKKKGNAFGNLTSLQTSITVISVNGKPFRKIWKASAVAKTAAAAYTAIVGFKPSEKNLQEEIERFFQECRATGVWVWEARRTNSGVTSYTESIEVFGGGKRWIVDPRVGGLPQLKRGRKGIRKVVLRGVVRGLTDKISAPSPHWASNDKDIARQEDEEVNGLYPTLNEQTRLYELPYMEVYYFKDLVTSPNHRDHKDIVVVVPPSDGTIGST